jgi:hypothetical protein
MIAGRGARALARACLTALAPVARAENVGDLLVPLGAAWRYRADGSNQGSAWRAPGFDDSGWAQGPAELGYGDGLHDFPADAGCAWDLSAIENPKCDDDADNDGDGGVDFDGGAAGAGPDPECAGKPFRNRELPGGCGLGAEIALAMLALARLRRGR